MLIKLITERRQILIPIQFQLILGDYFKVYDAAQMISELPTDLIGWLNNHRKVHKMFDASQAQISLDRRGQSVVLAYLVANLTRWTTHCIAFIRLLRVQNALKLKVIQNREGIIHAQVGAATYAEKDRLTRDAIKHCDLIANASFWSALEDVMGDIEPICYGTNINQKDSTRADEVLLTLAGIFLHFDTHPVPEVANGMKKRIDKRWKDCDQPLFILAVILNPFEGFSHFGDKAGMNHFLCNRLLISVSSFSDRIIILLSQCSGIHNRPSNTISEVEQGAAERRVSAAFMRYLASTGQFAGWREMQADWEESMGKDPNDVWSAFESDSEVAELSKFAKMIFSIVVNQAGCERTFSDLKVKQMDRCSRLGLQKLDKMTKVSEKYDIHLAHDSPQPRSAPISSPSIRLMGSQRPNANDQCTSPWRLSWRCPGTRIFWRTNTMKTRASEDVRWSRVLVAGGRRWQSGSVRPGRLNLRRVTTTRRERTWSRTIDSAGTRPHGSGNH